MTRVTKTVGFSVPPPVMKEVEQIAKAERRTKSELFREMVRVYQRYRKLRDEEEDRWVTKLIQEAKEEQENNPKTPEELNTELKALADDVAQATKKRGIKSKDVNRIIYGARKRWGTA